MPRPQTSTDTARDRQADAEEALRGLHRRVLELERENQELRSKLGMADRRTAEAESRAEDMLNTRTFRMTQRPRQLYAVIRDRRSGSAPPR